MRSAAVHSAPVYDRWYFLAIFVSGYVALAALRHVGAEAAVVGVLVGNPLLLAWVWRQTRPGLGPGRAAVHATALAAARACAWGTGLWIAARVAPVERPAFDMAANLGLGSAVVAAQVALARLMHRQGLIKPPRSARSLDAALGCALLWGVATAIPAARALWPGDGLGLAWLDALGGEHMALIAAGASWAALLAAGLRCGVTRRLELGVAERATGALALALTALALAALAALAGVVAPERALSGAALATSLGCVWAVTAQRAAAVSSGWRGALSVTLLGAPIVLTAGMLARDLPRLAGPIALCGASLALGVALLSRRLARSLAPEPSRWLSTLRAASRAALVPEPNAAIVATLDSLQALDPSARTRPELWRAEPPEVLSVDVAGYLHTSQGQPPSGVFELASSEPEQMLRRDVLAHLEVRRPEVRPVLAWMDAREALAVTLVCDEQAPLGFLLLPRGGRTRPITLAEAEAARQLAERLSAVLGLSSSMVRARAREQQALQHAERLGREVNRLQAIIEEHARPRDLLIDALAASARVAAYSARARLTLEQLERSGASGSDLTLEVPVGVDALSFACVFHLASPRRAAPLVVADGTLAASHAAERWSQLLASPGSQAQGGTLLVLNAAAMPHAAQDALAVALAARGAAPYALIASVAAAPRGLLEARHLSRALAQFLLPNVLTLPALIDRPEDLRGLILDRLCRSGVRYAGEPLGIEPQAMSLLVDYTWPGNDVELQSVVERAARAASGERVSVADLAAVGFPGLRLEADEPTPVAAPERRGRGPISEVATVQLETERPVARRRRRR